MQWQLSEAQVIDRGRQQAVLEGVFHDGFKLQARALASGGSVLAQGRFTLTLQAFSPARDAYGQKAGRWYVKGLWLIESLEAMNDGLPQGSRNRPGTLSGLVSADLARNPLTDASDWSAVARISSGRFSSVQTPQAVQSVRAEGSLTFNRDFEGALVLTLNQALRSGGG